jgi:hypothetical protein
VLSNTKYLESTQQTSKEICQQCNFRGCPITPTVSTQLVYFNFNRSNNANIFISYNMMPRSRRPGLDSRQGHRLFSSLSRPEWWSLVIQSTTHWGTFPGIKTAEAWIWLLYMYVSEEPATFIFCAKLLFQSQSYFTTGSLASSPMRLTTRDFFFQLNLCGNSPYVWRWIRIPPPQPLRVVASDEKETQCLGV